jgi:hypothetical protein
MRTSLLTLAVLSLGCSSRGGAPTAAASASAPAASASTPAAEVPLAAPALPAPPLEHGRFVGAARLLPGGARKVLLSCGDCPGDKRAMHVWEIGAGGAAALEIATLAEGEEPPTFRRFSPRGTTVAYTTAQALLLRSLDGSEGLKVAQGAVYDQIGWSPDERWFLWADAYGAAELVEWKTKKTVAKASMHDPNAGDDVSVEWFDQDHALLVSTNGGPPWVADAKKRTITKLAGLGDPAFAAVVPGGSLVVADRRGLVALVNLASGKVRDTLRQPDKSPADEVALVRGLLSPDGKRLVLARMGKELTLFDLEQKKATPLVSENAQVASGAAWSPDGKRLALVDATEASLLDAESGTLTQLGSLDLKGTPDLVEWSPDGAELAVHAAEGLTVVTIERATPPKPGPRVGAGQREIVGYTPDGLLVTFSAAHELAALRRGLPVWRAQLSGDSAPRLVFGGKWVIAADGRVWLVRASDGKAARFELAPDGDKAVKVTPVGSQAEVQALLSGL